MPRSRKEIVSQVRSQEELEDDALDLREKKYSYKAIGDLQGVSPSTAKSRVKEAKIRSLEGRKEKTIPFPQKASGGGA